jgi:hypothetical protein
LIVEGASPVGIKFYNEPSKKTTNSDLLMNFNWFETDSGNDYYGFEAKIIPAKSLIQEALKVYPNQISAYIRKIEIYGEDIKHDFDKIIDEIEGEKIRTDSIIELCLK